MKKTLATNIIITGKCESYSNISVNIEKRGIDTEASYEIKGFTTSPKCTQTKQNLGLNVLRILLEKGDKLNITKEENTHYLNLLKENKIIIKKSY